ncbi:serine protease [uncultured Methylobacterium sp.]|uniref:S1 family peptidase n=1 Tax=uncultured Methylobacterium sp. TaxID=157278 RepID=UPI0035CB938C
MAGLPAAQGAAAQGSVGQGATGPAPAPRPKAPAAAPDPAFEAMRPAFEALPESERRGLQDALVWTGDYNSVINGSFGRRTFEALNAFRTRTAPTADALDPRLRAAILAAGEASRAAARFTVRPDAGSGAVLGVPERLLPKRGAIPGGTRWQSADGRLTLESRSYPAGTTDLDALFEAASAPVNGRQVTYKLKRPDFVVVTAEAGAGRSYVRYASGPEGIRGFAIGYDRAQAAEIDRLVIAIANSFVPFPGSAAPVEVPRAAAPSVAAPVAAVVQTVGTGLVVAAGRVLTTAAVLEACPTLRIGTAPARLVRSDPARGLALLDAADLPGPRRPVFPGRPDAGAGRVVVAAEASGVSVAPGSALAEDRVTAPLQPGAGGAPVLDRSGALAGVVARFPASPRLIAGVMPPASYPVVPGAAVAAFLAENGIAAAAPAARSDGTGAAASVVGGAVVGFTCPR